MKTAGENYGIEDVIPLEDTVQTLGPDERGMVTELFYAFNTVVTLQAFGDEAVCRAAFAEARGACRTFERRYSRTLPHSDIARINAAGGAPVAIARDTAELLRAAQGYCADSEGCFDITVGPLVRLWDFHEGIVPTQARIDEALAHVDWRALRVWEEPLGANLREGGHEGAPMQAFAQLSDPEAAVDVGGIAKGWIADRLTELLAAHRLDAFIVNLGGNVAAHGQKPDGSPWRIGLQDPHNKEGVVGSVAVRNASAVTSGIYERYFTHNGQRYHHILNPQTGYPADTDAAGATVVAQRSLDAEGYSTTLLALGIERGIAFARKHPAILAAYFVDNEGTVHET
ncbi:MULTISPECIES: FAD:protein FMN transferase [Gordonibacter]|uniref:FAD:protein FMN transferase n=1 Tax=Gordonibacter faecis TaxID=3047475 RepID=A0ABT7DJR0_9ACTN|nr:MULTISPECIES: FAD:protein FMN transferase [unclassified Gordonibacter]MDJ1649764.1 FAD:protein FMN transferase [Gordonibacter sp. KGMB12511]HIW75430.1 FAD:protein FMN transferase [Candidatus Gordonibacter avicola]